METITKEILNTKIPEIVSVSQKITDCGTDVFIPVFKEDFGENNKIENEELKELDKNLNGMLSRNIKLNKFDAEEESKLIITLEDRVIGLIGCGNIPTHQDNEYIENKIPGNEKIRLYGILSSKNAKTMGLDNVSLAVRGFDNYSDNDIIYRILVESFVRGLYSFKYKNTKNDKENKKDEETLLNKISILTKDDNQKKQADNGIKKGISLGKSINFTRSLIDEPANKLYPETMVELVRDFLKDTPCEIDVWSYSRIKDEGMGCFAGVAQGNEGHKTEARFMIIRSKKKASADGKKIALVGKGVTFDTGGYNIKTNAKLFPLMKFDMGGAATIIGATKAILDYDMDVELVTAIALTENSVSRSAIKPGDVLTAYNGKTVEVLNTDAEGRLILADALSYIEEREKPDYIVDAATLTGASLISLGTKISAFMGNNPKLNRKFYETSMETGEPFWELPLSKKNAYYLKGTISDLKNINNDHSSFGGTLIGGLFLKEFIGECKNWIHLDILATVYALGSNYMGDGALGSVVPTIVKYAENIAKGE